MASREKQTLSSITMGLGTPAARPAVPFKFCAPNLKSFIDFRVLVVHIESKKTLQFIVKSHNLGGNLKM